ncbi:unnamed protein product [Ectocarpus sp. CCAP 1310/34]|nr:unnamed protein product [Ectocarpus sp. CCAP 1310/34]
MEQVFFRLHVRFVTTVTRLLSPKTRRLLEYVTLANAFLLVTSLAWLHTRFVNPKGSQGSAVSCLPAALEKAGVDPAQLHVLQIHIRQPPDDWGGGGGGGRRKNLMSFPDGSSRIDDSSRSGTNAEQQVSDSRRHSGGAAGDAGLGISGLGGGESGYASATGTAASACTGSGEEEGAAGTMGSESSSSSSSSGGGGWLLPPRLDSPPLSPEIFYSMKLVTGKDAVGTLSGPGTLGIERCVVKGGDGVDGNNPAGGGGGGGGICGAVVEEKRPALVQTLMDAFSWGGKGETGIIERGRGGGAVQVPAHSQKKSLEGMHRNLALSPPEGGICTIPGGSGEEHVTPRGAVAQSEGGGGALSGGERDAAACAAVSGDCHEHQNRGRGDGAEDGGGGSASGRDPDEVYLYSLEKGFLMLRPDLRRKHGIVTANVTVNAHDPCLGSTVVQALVKDFVGYDTVVMNWLISLYGGRGFLYSVHNNELFNLNYAAEFIESTEDVGKFFVFKIGVLFTTLFLFFTTTTLVSFTLRETQERMLKFTFLLQHHVRHRLPYAPLIFTHVVESLVFVPIMVGILFFLFEFFSDQLLAFMVLSVVWLCEVYSVVSVRTAVCIRFFPQVFFLYFTLFHVYFFSFPFGFSYLALVTTVLFLQHSMLFCWNRYEASGGTAVVQRQQAGTVPDRQQQWRR